MPKHKIPVVGIFMLEYLLEYLFVLTHFLRCHIYSVLRIKMKYLPYESGKIEQTFSPQGTKTEENIKRSTPPRFIEIYYIYLSNQ